LRRAPTLFPPSRLPRSGAVSRLSFRPAPSRAGLALDAAMKARRNPFSRQVERTGARCQRWTNFDWSCGGSWKRLSGPGHGLPPRPDDKFLHCDVPNFERLCPTCWTNRQTKFVGIIFHVALTLDSRFQAPSTGLNFRLPSLRGNLIIPKLCGDDMTRLGRELKVRWFDQEVGIQLPRGLRSQ
jgi:hypothetical protein